MSGGCGKAPARDPHFRDRDVNAVKGFTYNRRYRLMGDAPPELVDRTTPKWQARDDVYQPES
jgi:hypothetical protein